MKRPIALVALLAGAALCWLVMPGAPKPGRLSAEPSAAAISPGPAGDAPAASAAAALDRASAAPIPRPPPPAWQTMAAAREHGDERAPPIERPLPESQAPGASAWELGDPVRYREYELRGQRRLRQEYLIAAEQELPKWKALLARARADGASPAAIAEAQDKIRRLEARQLALRRDEPTQARKQ